MESQKDIHSFGKNLAAVRRKKGYTQETLSEISGVSRRAIAHYEKHAQRPTIDKVKKLAVALGVTDEELLGTTKIKTGKTEDVSFKILKKVRIIEKLPTRDQNVIFSLINSLAKKNKLEGKL